MAHVLITTDYLAPGTEPGDEVAALLRENGHEPAHRPHAGPRTPEEQASLLDGFAGAILASEPVTAAMLEAAGDLKVLARSGVGYDSIDVEAAQARGVRVCNAPGTNHHSVAELALGLLISVARRIPQVHAAVADGGWPRDAGQELRGAVLGVVGYGPSGRAIAQLGRALGMRVRVVTQHPDPSAEEGISFTSMEEAVAEADYLTLHTKASRGAGPLIDASVLKAMKPSAALINTARGSLVDEQALADALASGEIAAAGLDVLEAEPLPESSPLRGLDSVIITSHLAGQTAQARRRAGLVAAQAVVDVLAGREPAHPVDR